MADRYVDPAVGASGTGGSWAQAYKTLLEATAAAAAGEKIYFSNATADVITANTTYVMAAGVQIISTSDLTNSPPTTYAVGATVSSTTSGVDILMHGQWGMYGVTIKAATAGTATLGLASTDDDTLYAEDCTFAVPSNSSSSLTLGANSSRSNSEIRSRNCTWLFGNASSSLLVIARWYSIGDTFASSGTVPTVLITDLNSNNSEVHVQGADLSAVSGTLVIGQSTSPSNVYFISCKLHATVTPMGTATSAGATNVYLQDCSYENSGVQGKLFYHENYLGSTTIDYNIYANDGAQYDGTNRCSWVVDGKTAATFEQPYESPWIDCYNGDVATSVTPNLECVRSGSATAYTDALVWSEFLVRDTANEARFTLKHNRRGPLAAAADQTTGALGAADWTGENATSWFGKLDAPAALTFDEVGYVRARVCVVGDNTIYVDPKIRGLA